MVGGKDNQIVVTVSTAKLLETLRANRTQHEKDFNEALAAYKRQIANQLVDLAAKAQAFGTRWERAEASALPDIPHFGRDLHSERPRSYVDEYNRVIGMLEMHTGVDIKLDVDSYRRYVNDEWDWAVRAKGVFASYTGSPERH